MRPTLGLPRMHKEAGEKRDWLPDLVAKACSKGVLVVLEDGIGSGMGLPNQDYLRVSPNICVADRATCFQQDVVLVLRCPEVEEFDGLLRPKSVLVSMVHFPTRPRRVKALRRLGVDAVSLDCLLDDGGRRVVENTHAVGWNGVEAAFGLMERAQPDRLRPDAHHLKLTVLDAGMVGQVAVAAAGKYGGVERSRQWGAQHVPPVEVTVLGRGLTANGDHMESRLRQTDVLVDANQRSNASVPLLPNDWLGWLPNTPWWRTW